MNVDIIIHIKDSVHVMSASNQQGTPKISGHLRSPLIINRLLNTSTKEPGEHRRYPTG